MPGKGVEQHPYLRRRQWHESLWLRGLVRTGGVGVLLGGLLSGLLANGELHVLWQQLGGRSAANLGLVAEQVEVRGLRWQSPRVVLAALGVDTGESLVGFSPARARKLLENLDWVKHAEVLRRYPNGLIINIEERTPVARWRVDGQTVLVDAEGGSIASLDMRRFAHLPLVAGEGANTEAALLVNFLSDHPDISSRLGWAEFVGGRRWNLHMRSGLKVLLPEHDVGAALQRLAELQRLHGVLDRAVSRLDLRSQERLVLAAMPAAQQPAGADR